MESNSDIQSNAIPHSVMGMNLRSMLSEREQSQIRKVTESTVHRQLPEGGAKRDAENRYPARMKSGYRDEHCLSTAEAKTLGLREAETRNVVHQERAR